MVSSSSSSGFPSMRPPNFQYFPNISCSNEFCKCSASSKSGRVVSGMIGANQWGFHAQKCLCSSAFVCFHQQILGFHNQKLGLSCNHEDCMLSLSLSIHNCTYVHYCQGNKEQLQLKQNDDLSQTNMGDIVEANWRDESHQQGSLVLLPNALVFVHLLPQCSCFSAARRKDMTKKQIFSKFNQHFQSFTHLLGANSRCYWEQIGTSNHTKRPWHPSAWCQSFLLFPPPFACV